MVWQVLSRAAGVGQNPGLTIQLLAGRSIHYWVLVILKHFQGMPSFNSYAMLTLSSCSLGLSRTQDAANGLLIDSLLSPKAQSLDHYCLSFT